MSVTTAANLSKRAARLIGAALVACLCGVLTEWSVPHLPEALAPLANTAAPWILVAFLIALAAARVGEAVVLGVVALVALTLGFYVAQAARGWGVDEHQVVFWCISSLVFGPVVGLAAGWLRYCGAAAGALGAGAIGGLLGGEAVHGLRDLTYTPTVYWHVQFAVGVGLAIVLTLWGARDRLWIGLPALVLSAGAFGLAAAVTMVAYGMS